MFSVLNKVSSVNNFDQVKCTLLFGFCHVVDVVTFPG